MVDIDILSMDLDEVLPPFEVLDKMLPTIGPSPFDREPEPPPVPPRIDRPLFESICDAYVPGDAACAEDLFATREAVKELPDEADRRARLAAAFKRHGIDTNVPLPTDRREKLAVAFERHGIDPPAPLPAAHGDTEEPTGTQAWGPEKWRELEDWAGSIPCPPCRDFGQRASGAMHDMVNVKLGKPVHDRANLEAFIQDVKATEAAL